MAEYVPQIGCLADRWAGSVSCTDNMYPDFSPSTCTGEKMNDDCNMLKLTFNFWNDGNAEAPCELQFGEIDFNAFTGDITLLEDVSFISWGYNMTFHAGSAGTYNALSNELHLEFKYSGVDIGGGTYNFNVKQSK